MEYSILVVQIAAVDIVSFHVFTTFAAPALSTIGGTVGAWLASLSVSYPLRAWVSWRLRQRTGGPGHLPLPSLPQVVAALAAAAASSSCILVLSMLLLKLELQERGEAMDAALYSWHVATFFLGVAFAPACSTGPTGPSAASAAEPDLHGQAHCGIVRNGALPHALPPVAMAGAHRLTLATMVSGSPASPLAASCVALGALGVLPSWCSFSGLARCGQRRIRGAELCGTSRQSTAALLLTIGCAAALGAYIAMVRLIRAPSGTLGPLTPSCADLATMGAAGGAERRLGLGRPLGVALDAEELEPITLGGRWSLLGLMYGTRTVMVPSRCAPFGSTSEARLAASVPLAATELSAAGPSSAAAPSAAIAGVGVVLAADGSQPKYADAVYVALHNLLLLQRSQLPAEVFHVGPPEAFSAPSRARLEKLGGGGRVRVLDMLPRLHPSIRAAASRRLRSFAAKPFAALAASFDVVLLVDANALFFAPPERLLTLQSYLASGVQLFTDYVRSYHIVDPWLVSGYLGRGGSDVEAYASITLNAEIDSSVVVVDKRRAWRYLHVVCALNWWKAILDRHTWGDKDTWALAAVALAALRADTGAMQSAAAHASAMGSRVGWLTRTSTPTPTAVWGHVQFDASRDRGSAASLLYLNWQPHYAAGHIPFQSAGATAHGVACCVLHSEHPAGPHDENPQPPSIDTTAHSAALARTFADARDALREVGAGVLEQPHWWGQVRYRRCIIYFAVMAAGVLFAAAAVCRALVDLAGRPLAGSGSKRVDGPDFELGGIAGGAGTTA
jgi:hypothetical protein